MPFVKLRNKKTNRQHTLMGWKMNSECYFHGKWLITVIVVNQNDDASASHFLRLKLFEAPYERFFTNQTM